MPGRMKGSTDALRQSWSVYSALTCLDVLENMATGCAFIA